MSRLKETVLYIDFGNTLTKVMLLEIDDTLRVIARGEALTTAGYGVDDVSIALEEAISNLQDSYSGRLLSSIRPLRLHPESIASTLLVTSSVAGGAVGAVGGVFRDISAESAQRAVLLSGASVSDVFAVNDNRLPHQKRVALRQRPVDFLFLAGGVDEHAPDKNPGMQAVSVAKILCTALPKEHANSNTPATVVYGGSRLVRENVEELFSGIAPVEITENVRPEIEHENLEPARHTLLELFQKKMRRSKRYGALDVDVALEGYALVAAVEALSRQAGENTLVVDVGGAFTTVCSVIDGSVNRTVADFANLVSNGQNPELLVEDVMKWVPFKACKHEVGAILGNRRIRPGTLPETFKETVTRLGIVREEARLGLEHHKHMAVHLRGIQRKRQIWEIFGYSTVGGQTLVDLTRVPVIVLCGGWLKHASAEEAMCVALEGLQTAGVSQVYADEHAVLPAMGMLLEKGIRPKQPLLESLSAIGTVVSPTEPDSKPIVSVGALGTATVESRSGKQVIRLQRGKVVRVPLERDDMAEINISPQSGQDFGRGPGKRVKSVVRGGALGIVFDTRSRPLALPASEDRRIARLREWWDALALYGPERNGKWEASSR